MSSPDRPDEIVMAPQVAKQFGFHVGQVIPYGFYSDAQQNLPGFGTKAVPPALRANLKLVGLATVEFGDRRRTTSTPSPRSSP